MCSFFKYCIKQFNESIPTFCFRFFLGSNKVMQVALGRSVADEIRPGLHKISKVGRWGVMPLVISINLDGGCSFPI